jgi:histidine phosphotransferase ChpT
MDEKHLFVPKDLAALVGSRLCHDLTSPIGAIGNGLELLGMTGIAQTPEMSLIADAVHDANARIRFFRLAFGAASNEHHVPAREITEILEALYSKSRLKINWLPDYDLTRLDTKLGFLMINCAESALPMGGTVTMALTDGRWRLTAQGARLNIDPLVWQSLEDPMASPDLRPAHVQFALLHQEAERHGRSLRYRAEDTTLEMTG